MRPGRRWESDELELVVEEYMRMLADIRSQKPVNKLATARSLAECLGRTRSAVEYVWGNISYVLHTNGREWMEGEPPRGHASKLLTQIVTRLA
mgnify:CR=1 FL=1